LNLPKRLFDLVCSLLGIFFIIPVFVVVALFVSRDGGPVFFRHERVGKDGRLFRIYKFRSMMVNADTFGPQITAEKDSRITGLGIFLRKNKLDELPQLFNVFWGQMSLVGPRPEVPYYVDMWREGNQRIVLSVRPGITDYATLFYNDEQAVLAEIEDTERVYIEKIMPHKLRLNRRYVMERSFWLDIRIILATLCKIIGIQSALEKKMLHNELLGMSYSVVQRSQE
jgi:lipopolysaccharide/colanic/teichoic acid biosynthesis glycosyltransferase